MNEIILPVNIKDCLKSYTHNAFISSILLSNEVGGDVAAQYEITSDNKDFDVIDNNCCTVTDSLVTVNANRYKTEGYSLVYRDCRESDSVIIHVLSRRRISSWEGISIIVDDRIKRETFNHDETLSKFACPSNQNLFVKRRGDFLSIGSLKKLVPLMYFLKIEKKGLKLNYYYSFEGKKWHEVYTDMLPEKYLYLPLSIGVLVEMKNDYMNWFVENYIQITLAPVFEGSRMADYFFPLTKNYRPFYTSQFMDFYTEYLDCDEFSSGKMADWLYGKLKERFYLFCTINHYYIRGSSFYGTIDHYHEIMIYGINKNKEILLMGYNELDMLETYRMSFSEFWKSLNKNNTQITLGKISLNHMGFQVNPQVIKRRLQDYLEGENRSMDYDDIVPQQPNVAYGINVLDTLISNDEELFAFCRETRLSYFLYEHNLLMVMRVEYLISNGFLGDNEEETDEILSLSMSNLKLTEMIKNNILKSEMFMSTRTTMEKIKGYLVRLIEGEKQVYELICNKL